MASNVTGWYGGFYPGTYVVPGMASGGGPNAGSGIEKPFLMPGDNKPKVPTAAPSANLSAPRTNNDLGRTGGATGGSTLGMYDANPDLFGGAGGGASGGGGSDMAIQGLMSAMSASAGGPHAGWAGDRTPTGPGNLGQGDGMRPSSRALQQVVARRGGAY